MLGVSTKYAVQKLMKLTVLCVCKKVEQRKRVRVRIHVKQKAVTTEYMSEVFDTTPPASIELPRPIFCQTRKCKG